MGGVCAAGLGGVGSEIVWIGVLGFEREGSVFGLDFREFAIEFFNNPKGVPSWRSEVF